MLVPGHGPVIFGAERAAQILNDGAEVLEGLVTQTLDLMNKGRSLDEILHTVSAPQSLIAKPYLLPKYDDPEFVVRNIWHLYAGWFDGDPAHLKPAPAAELAGEIAALAVGPKSSPSVPRGLSKLAHTAGGAFDRVSWHRFAKVCGDSGYSSKGLCTVPGAETSLIGKAIFAVYQRDAKARSIDQPRS